MSIDNGIFKNTVQAITKIAKATHLKIKKYSFTSAIILAVLASTIVNSYYRPIQEKLHIAINWVYDINEPVGEALYEVNGFVLNGKMFDQERKAKNAIYDSYSSVVMIGVASEDLVLNRSKAGRGTGFIIEVSDDYALVATNHHVVDAAINDSSFKVNISTAMDMWQYEAEIIGYDEITDVAVLKIYKQDNEDWTALTLSKDEDIGVGDPVVVIGHGMSMPWTSTQGHIVYKDRYGSRPYSLMLQVDAVINQGNSGGPIIDMKGEVIGIAQSIYSPGRQIPGWDGVGMAISSKQAIRTIDYILSPQYNAKTYVPYAEFPFSLGTFKLEEVLDIPKKDRRYSYIDYTTKKPDAEATVGEDSGLLQGDIIVSINGDEVFNSFYVMRKTIYAFPGDEWEVVVKRNDELITVKIALREMDRSKLLNSLNVQRGGR
jgi:serine protease Do